MKRAVLVAALAAGMSGIANADDNSMSRWGGDSHAYFSSNPNRVPGTFHQNNPHGVSIRELQALSSDDPVWQLDPIFASAPLNQPLRLASPRIDYREMQALSASAGSAWELTNRTQSAGAINVARSPNGESFAARLAGFLHISRGASVDSIR
jgi:hypothetical protein